MGTDKKNRTQREDKESTGSVDNGSNSSADASASLAARRAKLRGALGGRGSTQNDPFSSAPSTFQNDPYGTPSSDTYGSPDPAMSQPSPAAYGTKDPFSSPIDYSQNATESEYENETPVNVYGVPINEEAQELQSEIEAAAEAEVEAMLPAQAEIIPEPKRSRRNTAALSSSALSSAIVQAAESKTPAPSPKAGDSDVSEKTVELVNSIDQSLNACATNLAALQNLAGEQTEVLKGLSSTLQNQTLLEIGLNLNSLTESLSAALEPMKAIGELVPALDSLVTALEGKEQEQAEKLSPEQLVTSLADQLSAGLIDPWTFKCAYMAVYPADHPADLLHRLVELLGTQRLSGDLFRAAYEAVQAAEAPARATYSTPSSGDYRGISDENIKAQLESLDRSNREMQRRLEEREEEMTRMLAQKESELQETQEALNSRLEDLDNRYAEAAAREDEFRATLESKDMDLIEKDAELNMLRAQMEELRSETQSMVENLQKEMLLMKEEQKQQAYAAPQASAAAAAAEAPTVNSQGFFDALPSGPGQGRTSGLFEAAPSNKPFMGDSSGGAFQDTAYAGNSDFSGTESASFAAANQAAPASFQAAQNAAFSAPATPSFQAPPTPTFQPAQSTPAPAAAPQPTTSGRSSASQSGPGPSPPTTPQFGQSGSYGSGVRQQVFEVIVRQALAGAPWREICAGPMQVNNINADEVEAEVKRRQSLLNK
ncbi:MAG: DUF4200 domain-containing protein [Candidatus Obscuribacterales bacterium]|nr:DUF4200 domain-containing protein [Candidatus Obscuribacterales bacterium]